MVAIVSWEDFRWPSGFPAEDAGRPQGGHVKRFVVTVAAIGLLISACGGDAEPKIDVGDPAAYSVALGPSDFVERIDNPWLPFTPGSTWTYEGRDGDEVERIVVVVLDETRLVNGVTATVVRDTVTVDGELIEDTYDWYAQDRSGNVWYLGEDSTEYEDGEAVSKAGSWEWGVDGALPGIIMHADPQVGVAYRQEFYEDEAEDVAQVSRLDASVTVPVGGFNGVLVIKEWNPMEPDVVEEKYYARGIGVILEQKIEGGDERVELISAETAG
jgi:hypothetical protein